MNTRELIFLLVGLYFGFFAGGFFYHPLGRWTFNAVARFSRALEARRQSLPQDRDR
jgi:hypothetical protein